LNTNFTQYYLHKAQISLVDLITIGSSVISTTVVPSLFRYEEIGSSVISTTVALCSGMKKPRMEEILAFAHFSFI